ncbi:MAG TPA: hypothetical protein VHZ06_09270 [Marmoricola sp.]|jgi:hypothetical protein|nr:hypothetical protein [Marmoricola sp.]
MNRTTSHAAAAVLCAALLATGASGCGGSSSSGTSRKPPSGGLGVAGFKAQANAICKAGNADIKALGASLTSSASESALAAVLVKAADRNDETVAAVRKLKAPASIAADVTALLDAINAADKTINTEGAKVLNGASPFAAADAQAKALGLDNCESTSGT